MLLRLAQCVLEVTDSIPQDVTLSLLRDRRFFLTLLLTLTVGGVFWAGSRVPALNEKATMGGETNINSLGFETLIASSPNDPVWKRIGVEGVNWAHTNRKGMAFGVLFGGLMMTLFALLGRRRYKSVFANSAVGTLIGAPLGVCVNCAAPIAAGMASAGARLETTLAAMMSSPTLNVIVLSMLFALLPLHLALVKLGLTFLMLLVVVPLLVRHVFQKEAEDVKVEQTEEACALPVRLGPGATISWSAAAFWAIRQNALNIWRVFVRTVPLMLLAGLLGAVVITLFPWDNLAQPFESRNVILVLAAIAIIAVVGTFLPVPMSFDIIVCAVLLSAGMPVRYVGVLLFTLGIFSIYSFFIVRKTVSIRVAAVLYGAVVAFGGIAGVGAHFAEKGVLALERQALASAIFGQSGTEPRPVAQPVSLTMSPPLPVGSLFEPVSGIETGGLLVNRRLFSPRSSAGEKLFTRMDARHVGIDLFSGMHFMKLSQPFLHHGAAIASGDVHNDGLPDLLITSNASVYLYANHQGRFVAQTLDLAPVEGSLVLNAALVDLDGDGWLDVYVATSERGAWVFHNRGGTFDPAHATRLPSGDDSLMPAVTAFGDVDGDNPIDVVIGRWEQAPIRTRATPRSVPVLLLNRGTTFEAREITLPPGQPNAIMLTDFDADGDLDLIVAHDFTVSDYYLRGDGRGGFTRLARSAGVVPATAASSMSIASTDINGDLKPDLFVVGVGMHGDHDPRYPLKKILEICDELNDDERRVDCERDMKHHAVYMKALMKREVLSCRELPTEALRNECALFIAIQDRDAFPKEELCDRLQESWRSIRRLCEGYRSLAAVHRPGEHPEDVPQLMKKNAVLIADEGGRFVERGTALGIDLTGWAWNAKFNDLDNDGWRDLYVATGWLWNRQRQESNYFFRNLGGKGFTEATDSIGLQTFLPTTSYTYVDLDVDGDLDIVVVPLYGPVLVFRNNQQTNKSLQIALRDASTNPSAIGAKVTITHGSDRRRQMLEVQAGGGYLSFDEPILHFGLGSERQISRVEVSWPDGQKSRINGTLAAGARYVISRTPRGRDTRAVTIASSP